MKLRRLLFIFSLLWAAQVAMADVTTSVTPFLPLSITLPTTGQCLTYNGAFWVNSACGTASGAPFSGISAGTNGTPLVVGSGGSLSVTGTGTIAATSLSALAGLPTQLPGTVLSNCQVGSAAPSANTYICISLVPSAATFTASGCSNSTLVGGAVPGPGIASGTLVAGVSGTCTIAITLPSVNHNWVCSSTDVTSQIAFVQTVLSATGCTVTGVAASGDTITLLAVGN